MKWNDALWTRPVPFLSRPVAFVCVWVVTAVAFQVTAAVDAEDGQTGIRGRLLWIPLTPLIAGVGLAHAANLSTWPSESAVGAAPSFLGANTLVTLAVANRRIFVVALCLQIVSMTVAVGGLVPLGKLPSGG